MAKLSDDEARKAAAGLDGWAYGDNQIEKSWKFKDHVEAMGFVNRVALLAERADHHPDLNIVYSNVRIRLNTHSEGGVTEKDISLAKEIDAYQ
jgi:4a-hydroxytetrahydrobiopterin dehydratase